MALPGPSVAANDLNSMKKRKSLSKENFFCKVKLGDTSLKIILVLPEGDPLGLTLLKRCQDADYDCCLLHAESQVIESIAQNRHQCVIFLDVDMPPLIHGSSPSSSNNLSHFTTYINANGLQQNVSLLAIVRDLKTAGLMDQLLLHGVSRILTREECLGERLLMEIRMMEMSEVALKERQIFGLALYEAVEQSNDAIQITGKNSEILYVNRAFLDISGYGVEEVIGQPAMDILKPFDSKIDNGPKMAVKKGQSWDGICMGRRKSGSVLKQHLKLIPVHGFEDYVYHHVTIQRLLSAYDSEHRVSSPRANELSFMIKKQPSLSKIYPRLESPLIKVVQTLNSVRDNHDTPPDVREALDKAVETLSNSELYAIPMGKPSGGIVGGLLQSGRRYTPSGLDFSFMKMSQAHSYLPLQLAYPISQTPRELQEAMKDLDSWEFDIIKMENISKRRTLYYVGMKFFSEYDLCSLLNVDVNVVSSWLKLMENHYHSQNTYHNSTHAADVLQATVYFLKNLQDKLVLQGDMLDRWEIAALIITAIIHDLDHPGRTNPYLCNTRHQLAFLYNDNAVLENHHVALSYKLSEQSNDVNIFQNLDEATFRSLRTSIIDLVLATDMAKHFEHLTKFNVTVNDGGSEPGSSTNLLNKDSGHDNRMIMKKILVKCADISNPCRPLPLCKIWAERIAEEYFLQTEDEKQQNLPVVFPDFDRHTCRLPVTQVKFIDYFISGLFEMWNGSCPIPMVMDMLKSNYEYWKSQCPDSPNYSEEETESSN